MTAWWFDCFRTSMRVVDHLLFGSIVVDPATGEVVAHNRRTAELLGGWVPDRLHELVDAGVLSGPDHRRLLAATPRPGAGWKGDLTLHLPDGRRELTVFAATVLEPWVGARAVVAMLCERGRERIWVDASVPEGAPGQLVFSYDDHFRVRGVDPRMAAYWSDPSMHLDTLGWLGIHPGDLPMVTSWIDRLLRREVDAVEYTARVMTSFGNWTPAHAEVRRLLGAPEPSITAVLTLVGEFRTALPQGLLTPRELEIVDALFEGLRVPQIGARDAVSVKTLRNQLTGIYRKLGVGDQGELLARYHRPRWARPLPRSVIDGTWSPPT